MSSSDEGHYIFCHMRNLPTSNAFLPSTCDEELADDADEPPEDRSNYFFSRRTYSSLSDGEFSKHSNFDHIAPKESLLTRALLTSPILGPVDRSTAPTLARGMSNSSMWSNTSVASTADLTSDAGMTSPSRSNTPSPPPPMYLAGIAGVMQHTSAKPTTEPQRIAIVGERDDAVEGLGRKRCITFACNGGPSRRDSEDGISKADDFTKQPVEPAPPKKSSTLTFVCTQREESQKSSARSLRSPPPVARRIDFAASHCPESRVGAPAPVGYSTASKPVFESGLPSERKLYDFECAADSWTNLPIDKSRLLKVDDLLRKEMDIRKLSEEAEAEALQEEDVEDDAEEEEEEDGTLVDDAEDDEDIEDQEEDDYHYDDDDDDDDDDYDGESGNETDNEEGFASGDESDDDGFFGLHPPMVIRTSPTREPGTDMPSPRYIRSATPELPDSTDFVCGTFDEDKPLEEAYMSCMEARKRSKHKEVPQDIDPSFPTSEPEDSEPEDEPRRVVKVNRDDSSSDGNQSRGRKLPNGAAKNQSPPRGMVHSPAPVRWHALAQSPAPTRHGRSGSPPPLSRRGSTRRRTQFHTGNNIVRARSLPRNPALARRNGRSSRNHSAAGSPVKSRPVVIRRGAMDIVKGLEKKRERRKARLCRKDKEELWKAGEGVEKMRELGLEICGKGRSRPIWVISA